jgi:hypothetical protein
VSGVRAVETMTASRMGWSSSVSVGLLLLRGSPG